MACGYAKFTGRLGVCVATSGPGGIHLLNGLYDAKLDQVPVLAITGMTFHDLVHTFSQQDVELDKLFMDVSVYNSRIMDKTHIEPTLDLAIHAALGYRGVAHVTIPTDIQVMDHGHRSRRNLPHHTSDTRARSARVRPRRIRGRQDTAVASFSFSDWKNVTTASSSSARSPLRTSVS